MSRLSIKATKLIAVFLLISLIAPVALFAQDNNDQQGDPNNVGQALEISPPVKTLSVDPGQTITTEISLRNVSPADLIVTGQINDFVASGEDGTPKLLLDEEEEQDNPYSFKGWVNPLPELLLVPQEVKTFPVTIQVPEDASPGGHYGVIRFSGVAPELDDTGVSLSASLGTLMLVTVSGDTIKSLEIEEFFIDQDGQRGSFFESTPLNFVQRLKNTGNTHAEPSGRVTITDMFGNKVAGLNVNLPPRNILPSSIRRFEQPLDSTVIGNKRLFGRYTAEVEITYGEEGEEQTITESMAFWVIPYRLIAFAIVLLVISFFVLRSLLRRYNRYILSKAKK